MSGASSEEKTRIETLALRVLNLLMLAAMLVPDLDLLEKVESESSQISSNVLAAAPVIEAVGGDYEEKHMEAELRRKRSIALVNLVRVIRDTDIERTKFKKDQATKRQVREKIMRRMGL